MEVQTTPRARFVAACEFFDRVLGGADPGALRPPASMPAISDMWRRSIAALALAVLLWQAAAGIRWMGTSFAGHVRTEGLFDTEEQRVARALGPHYETLNLLRERVPEDGLLYCNLVRTSGPEALDDAFLLNRLRHALHPRYVHGLDFREPRLRRTLVPTTTFYVCDFAPGAGSPPPAPMKLPEKTRRVELWAHIEEPK
jgi:hypothetical protein